MSCSLYLLLVFKRACGAFRVSPPPCMSVRGVGACAVPSLEKTPHVETLLCL